MRRVVVVAMRLVEVDVVGLSRCKSLGRLQDVGLREALLARPHLGADLGGDQDLSRAAAPLSASCR